MGSRKNPAMIFPTKCAGETPNPLVSYLEPVALTTNIPELIVIGSDSDSQLLTTVEVYSKLGIPFKWQKKRHGQPHLLLTTLPILASLTSV